MHTYFQYLHKAFLCSQAEPTALVSVWLTVEAKITEDMKYTAVIVGVGTYESMIVRYMTYPNVSIIESVLSVIEDKH